MSLSSVVSNLVRASMGASVPSSVTDDDLDRHVAELILKEAKQKLAKYNTEGIRAYLPQPESNAPKTNKRFLSSIIRNTDDHNKTILRAQAVAAQEVRQERLEQEKQERRARAEEATQAERMRRMMGRGGVEWAHNWDRGESRDRNRDRDRDTDRDRDRRRRERSWERRDDEGSSRSSRKGKERADRDEREERHSRRHRSRSPAPEKSDSRRRHRDERGDSRSRSPARTADSSHERRERREHRRSHHRRRRSRTPVRSDASPTREASRHRHERSHRRRRDRRSRSPDRSRRDTPEVQLNEARSKQASPSAEDDHLEDDSRGRSGEVSVAADDASPSSRIPRPPTPPPAQKRGRSPSPFVGPPSPPKNVESEDVASREDALRRKLKSRLDVEPEAGPSTSSRPSRNSTPGYSRASSSRVKEPPPPTSSSSRTRNASPSPGPPPPLSPPPPPPPKRSRAPSPGRTHTKAKAKSKAKDAPPQPASPPPPLPAHLPSKMDRYFEDAYDPRLDVAPLAAPAVPATGLVSDAEFAGWDAMLEVIRRRREDKEDRRRMERLGLGGAEKGREKEKGGKKKGAEGAGEVVDIMAIQYKKQGAVREWDLGKEGF